LPHVPQCGAPRSLGAIRLRAPQLAHVRIEIGPRAAGASPVIPEWYVRPHRPDSVTNTNEVRDLADWDTPVIPCKAEMPGS
jgi:hypothetical protein